MVRFLAIDVTAEGIAAARAGDSQARETIFRSYPAGVLADPVLDRPAGDCDELFQDTFVEVLRSLRGYYPPRRDPQLAAERTRIRHAAASPC